MILWNIRCYYDNWPETQSAPPIENTTLKNAVDAFKDDKIDSKEAADIAKAVEHITENDMQNFIKANKEQYANLLNKISKSVEAYTKDAISKNNTNIPINNPLEPRLTIQWTPIPYTPEKVLDDTNQFLQNIKTKHNDISKTSTEKATVAPPTLWETPSLQNPNTTTKTWKTEEQNIDQLSQGKENISFSEFATLIGRNPTEDIALMHQLNTIKKTFIENIISTQNALKSSINSDIDNNNGVFWRIFWREKERKKEFFYVLDTNIQQNFSDKRVERAIVLTMGEKLKALYDDMKTKWVFEDATKKIDYIKEFIKTDTSLAYSTVTKEALGKFDWNTATLKSTLEKNLQDNESSLTTEKNKDNIKNTFSTIIDTTFWFNTPLQKIDKTREKDVAEKWWKVFDIVKITPEGQRQMMHEIQRWEFNKQLNEALGWDLKIKDWQLYVVNKEHPEGTPIKIFDVLVAFLGKMFGIGTINSTVSQEKAETNSRDALTAYKKLTQANTENKWLKSPNYKTNFTDKYANGDPKEKAMLHVLETQNIDATSIFSAMDWKKILYESKKWDFIHSLGTNPTTLQTFMTTDGQGQQTLTPAGQEAYKTYLIQQFITDSAKLNATYTNADDIVKDIFYYTQHGKLEKATGTQPIPKQSIEYNATTTPISEADIAKWIQLPGGANSADFTYALGGNPAPDLATLEWAQTIPVVIKHKTTNQEYTVQVPVTIKKTSSPAQTSSGKSPTPPPSSWASGSTTTTAPATTASASTA